MPKSPKKLTNSKPVFRFAPSPNGALHLGHAYSALLNFDMAQQSGGKLLLRIEDIDEQRCNAMLEEQMLEDLSWLGLEWQEEPRRQSDHFTDYQQALDALEGLVYPAFLSRGEQRRLIERCEENGGHWMRDPDGATHYPDIDRRQSAEERLKRIGAGENHTLRLDIAAAIEHAGSRLSWCESGAGPDGQTGVVQAAPQNWGDVVLARRDVPTSYHLSVVVDDALQGVTHVVRGHDLFHATSVHRLLQELLGLHAPIYHHHELILSNDGQKLSKSRDDTSLQALRRAGATAEDIRRMVGL